MKILVTGVSGQVGSALRNSVSPKVSFVGVSHSELDIGDAAAVGRFIRDLRPDVVINAAAYTAVDKAETDAATARRVNEEGAANLAREAAASGARLIHLSTDFVFDGESSRPYRPDDPTGPLGVYGATKLAGERAVRALSANSVVLRTAWVYDASGRNFVRTMLRLMRERGSVNVVCDQVGTPTAAHSIAASIWAFVDRPQVNGVFHWTDSGVASWYDFAVAIAEEAVAAGLASTVATVLPISSADYATAARRPRFSVLDHSATAAALGMRPVHWRQNLRKVMGEMSRA
jgi:dTDP-4-dehydrorhamnose reductase